MATSPSRQVVLKVGCPENSNGLASQMKLLEGKLSGHTQHLLNQKLEMGVSNLCFAKLADDSDAHSSLRTTALDSMSAPPRWFALLDAPWSQAQQQTTTRTW